MKTTLAIIAVVISISATQGAEYKEITFRNELGKGKNGYLHMPPFDDIKELTYPCFIPDTPTNLLGAPIREEPYATLQKIIAAKRTSDLEGEYALSTKAFVDAQKPYTNAMKRLNDGWKYMSSIQLVTSIKVDGFEYIFLKCTSGQVDGFEGILLKLTEGQFRQACPDSRETSMKLNYVHSAFVTGAWAEKKAPSNQAPQGTTRTLAVPGR